MKNSIKAGINFYFKGEEFKPSTTIDLDMYFQGHHDLDFIYGMLAKCVNIDEYRHEYDVMMLEEIYYSEPQGIAIDYVIDGQLDWQGLQQAWQNHQAIVLLTPIANKFFNVENLADSPKLTAALLEVYRLGQDKAEVEAKLNTGLSEVFYG
ncbi:MAG: hypothetical protein Q9N67_09320 [Ghiorsea sp.]|nr:hypothetical protein [Ghiorsea sp.]